MKSEDISWPIDQTTGNATMTATDHPGRYPGVALVTGSAPSGSS